MYKALIAAIVLVSTVYVARNLIPILDGKEQYDFRTYYYAAQAYERGLDPYNLQSLRDVSGRGIILTFIYPPHCLTILGPLSRIGYSEAYFSFLAAKLLALGLLIWIWTRVVPTTRADVWPLLVTALLGYQGATMVDLIAGNLSIFEQALLWGGIYLLLRQKTVLGGVGIFLSSFAKLVTFALGPVIFIIERSRKALSIWLSLSLAVGLVYLASYLAQPELWDRFISSNIAASFSEKGHLNPSSLVLSQAIASRLGLDATAAIAMYIAWCILVACIWLWSCRNAFRSQDKYPLLYVTLLAYVAVSPKMMLYSLMIALLPTLHTISAVVPSRYRPAGCALLWVPLFDYQPLFLAVGIFFILVHRIYMTRDKPNENMELTLNPLRDL
jgi:hypothetical protein